MIVSIVFLELRSLCNVSMEVRDAVDPASTTTEPANRHPSETSILSCQMIATAYLKCDVGVRVVGQVHDGRWLFLTIRCIRKKAS